MKFAYDDFGKIVYLMTYAQGKSLVQQNKHYYCPDCQLPVQIRFRGLKTAYFCHVQLQKQDHEESELHLLGKYQLDQLLTQYKIRHTVEWHSDNRSRRADVACFLNNQKFALEWQCARISIKQIYLRTASYAQQNTKPLWLLGPAYHTKGLLKTHQAFMSYCHDLGFYNVYFQPDDQSFEVRYHLAQFDFNRGHWQTMTVKNESALKLLLSPAYPSQKLFPRPDPLSLNNKRQEIAKLLHLQVKPICRLQKQCYLAGHYLQQLPDSCFSDTALPPIFLQPSWQINCLQLLTLEKQVQWTYKAIFQNFKYLMQCQGPLFYHSDYWLDYSLKRFMQRLIDTQFLWHANGLFFVNRKKFQSW